MCHMHKPVCIQVWLHEILVRGGSLVQAPSFIFLVTTQTQQPKPAKTVRGQNQSFLARALLVCWGRKVGVSVSLVFWQCEKLPLALPLRCHNNFVRGVSTEIIRIPRGTSVFPPHQYAVGYSLSKTSCCDSSSTAQNTRYSILPTAQW